MAITVVWALEPTVTAIALPAEGSATATLERRVTAHRELTVMAEPGATATVEPVKHGVTATGESMERRAIAMVEPARREVTATVERRAIAHQVPQVILVVRGPDGASATTTAMLCSRPSAWKWAMPTA